MTKEEKERLDRIEKKLDDLLARPPQIVPHPYPQPYPVYPRPLPAPVRPWSPWGRYPRYPRPYYSL